jgi:hypothetical protein
MTSRKTQRPSRRPHRAKTKPASLNDEGKSRARCQLARGPGTRAAIQFARARSYVVEQSPDPPADASWRNCAVVVKSQATIEGLTSGKKYWFRVAAVGPNGQSGWSNPATKLAP